MGRIRVSLVKSWRILGETLESLSSVEVGTISENQMGDSGLELADQRTQRIAWRGLSESQSSGRGPEGNRDTLYGTLPASKRHKNRGRTSGGI